MRGLRPGKRNRAVSPVIAVILMVAITVVLAAVLYVTVQQIANQSVSELDTIGARLTLEKDGWHIRILSGELQNRTEVHWFVTDAGGERVNNITLIYNNLNNNDMIDPGDSFDIPE